MKTLFALSSVFLLLLTGCYASVDPIFQTAQRKQFTSFQIGLEQQTTLGDPMVIDENLYFYKGLVATSALNTKTLSLIEGDMLKLYGKTEKGIAFYKPVGSKSEQIFSPPFSNISKKWHVCVAVDYNGAAIGEANCEMDNVIKWAEPFKGLKEAPIFEEGSIRMELIYNGKTKDTVRLTYREFKNNFAQAAYTQDLTYDLSESKTIGFRKMRIDIVEATNSYIKFIIQHGDMR